MINLPINMEIINDQNQLTLSPGKTEIDYLFSSTISNSIPDTNIETNYFPYAIIGVVSLIALIGSVIIIRSKQKNHKLMEPNEISKKNTTLDLETIFKLKSDLREDDKELVKFIFNSGGEALESELRKKFLQPRTTMWRAVKRLEREGVIEIEKKDLQNLVKLRKSMGEEE
jgi:uncharacterized membrane protein